MGSDAVLNCSLSTKEDLTGKIFLWMKDGQKVFIYRSGSHSLTGQDEQFNRRVSHFQDQLMNGNASIKIQNTKKADSGNYSCIIPDLQSQPFNIELLVGPAVRVVVEEDSDAVLNCLISTKEDITGKLFDWRKDGQKEKKEVFFYVSGLHYNNGLTGQDEQFKGRVSHFQDQLKNGNASIKIHHTKMADSGNYSCFFPHHSQTFYIELVVERLLRDRSGEIPEDQSREVELWRLTAIVLAVLVAVVCCSCICCYWWKIHSSEPIKSDYHLVKFFRKKSVKTARRIPQTAEDQSSDVTDSSGLDSQDE